MKDTILDILWIILIQVSIFAFAWILAAAWNG